MNKSRVIFIELAIQQKERFTCDITEKFFLNGEKVIIYTANSQAASSLDRLLWTWKQDAFIPHLKTEEEDTNVMENVLITSSTDSLKNYREKQVLILYDPLHYDYWDTYPTVIDFAEIYDPERHVQSRSRYKKIRDTNNFDMDFMKLGQFLKSSV